VKSLSTCGGKKTSTSHKWLQDRTWDNPRWVFGGRPGTLSLTHSLTLSLSLSLSLTHKHTLTHTHTHTHTNRLSLPGTGGGAVGPLVALLLHALLSRSLSHTHTLSLSLSHTPTLSLSLTHTHTRSLSLSQALSLSHTHSLSQVAVWHDESHLNRYFSDNPHKFRVLPPSFLHPEGYCPISLDRNVQ